MVMRVSGLDGVDEVADEFRLMGERVDDLSPVGPHVHEELLVAHRVEFAENPVGQMRNLGPSIVDPAHPDHFWDTQPQAFEFGTVSEYAIPYEADTEREIVFADDETMGRIATTFAYYVAGLEIPDGGVPDGA